MRADVEVGAIPTISPTDSSVTHSPQIEVLASHAAPIIQV